jgi:cytochrome c-type biogenesis protein CcmE
VARKRSPARLLIALSIAAVLAVFLLYTSLAGGGTPTVQPSELPGHVGKVALAGQVIAPISGDAHAGGLRFRIRDVAGTATVPVVYTGTVPDLFKKDQHITVTGTLIDGVFVSQRDSMITKCPSRYVPKKADTPANGS